MGEIQVSATVRKPPKSARKAKGDGHLRRVEILQAAQRIFIEDGYEGATIRKIADDVGVSSTALYMHFSDKSEILSEICEDAFAELARQNRAIAELDCDPVARIRLILEAYIRFGTANPHVYQLVLCGPEGRFSGDRLAKLVELGMQPLNIFSDVVGEAVHAGRLKHHDAQAVAQTLWAAVHGLIALRITRPTVNWAPCEVLTRMIVDVAIDGLLAA